MNWVSVSTDDGPQVESETRYVTVEDMAEPHEIELESPEYAEALERFTVRSLDELEEDAEADKG